VRTMRGALLALAIGIIVGVGATLQFGMPGRSGPAAVEKPAAKAPLASAPAKVPDAALPAPATVIAPSAGAVTVLPDFASLAAPSSSTSRRVRNARSRPKMRHASVVRVSRVRSGRSATATPKISRSPSSVSSVQDRGSASNRSAAWDPVS
jgi:hypothetical protein